MKLSNTGYTLFIPSWYPDRQNRINGIFIKKHAQIVARFKQVHILYATADKSLNSLFEVTHRESDDKAGIRETIVYFKPSSINLFTQIRQIWALHKGFRLIVKNHKKPDVIHNHVIFPAGLYALFVSFIYRIPLLITEHWSGYTNEDGRFEKLLPIFRFLIRIVAKRAKKISVVSTYLKNALARKLHTSNIIVISNVLSVPPQVMQKKSSESKAGEQSTVRALYIGNLNDHEKNISGILKAIAIVMRQHTKVRLTLIGDGAKRESYKNHANKLGIAENVTFVGSVPNTELSAYYQSHDFYILNSHFETFNIATAEALLHGLPVIATRCGGPEEFITADNGILIEVNDEKQLAQAISKMTETYMHYNTEKIATNMKELYNNNNIEMSFKEMYTIL